MNDKAEEIRQRMLQVRNDIDGDVDELVVAAKALVDWKEYVRSAPWATAGLACALGFMIVPAKKKMVSVGEAVNQFNGSSKPATVIAAKKPSLLRVVAGNLAATTLRIAVAQVATHASSVLSGKAVGDSGQASFPEQKNAVESYDY